jgi:Dockerin type I domain
MKKILVLILVALCAASTIVVLRPIRSAKAVVPGDINGDGVVDISDAILASHAFGSSTGNPDYIPAADLNSDGNIDIFDMLMLARNFGRTG